ncbi:hypothetical protein AKJ49_00130 [candidate division MSBL1 archaeon SCGC-AAA382A03]|uniref:Nitroreductase domain-containing protein n=1 Tax=candidate division MSBL1 archaeon SCGC-AAA382A03 TaxID=1698278 RepID=A0A133VH40_9EURY|nr:hypothetical protein AKJ49_00130 [candidate division MSBL1 archaeon SCGC-AAA382A03]
MNKILESIRERRSVRHFTNEPVPEEKVEKILEAARWAPSGKNNQPWKFLVVREENKKSEIANCTHYSKTVNRAKVLIVVYLDNEKVYDRTKDIQSVGACCQNIWLATHALGLGAVWNGEILNHKKCVEKILETPESLELMAIFCIGNPAENPTSERIPLEDLLIENSNR